MNASICDGYYRPVQLPIVCDVVPKACRAAAAISDGTARIRTAVSMVIASIAQFYWPDAWPGLMAELVQQLEEPRATADTAAATAARPLWRACSAASSCARPNSRRSSFRTR